MFLAAAVQMNATSDADANLAQVSGLVRRAAAWGAKLVVTPENTNFLGPHVEKVRRAEPLDGPTSARFAALARELRVHLLVGSLNERSEDRDRCYNTSVLYGPDGAIIARYRKIHLFDVDVSADVRFLESDTIVAGADPIVADTALGRIGMTVCYDLRFPGLYQKLVEMGAQILTIPSAFTLTTGKDHWEPLIRARAIETQCYVIAPGQWGRHDDAGLRQSWGHSLIVDPWGAIVAQASEGPALALGEIDPTRVETVRRGMPVQRHKRF